MSNVKFRLAKLSDARQIACVHYHIRDKYDQGFFAQVNYAFLKQYYKIVLNDPCEVVVCAEDENQKIVGFCSASLDAQRQFKRMRRHKWGLILPLVNSAFTHPSLIKSALDRFKFTKGESDNEYVTPEGARAEYWGWLPNRSDSEYSVVMQDIMFYMMKMLGADKLYFEVDKINKKIFKFHKINGAKEIRSFTMPDGRERVELVYELNNYKFKLM